MSYGPFSALYFLFYEMGKEKLTNLTAEDYRNKVNQRGEAGEEAAHKQDIGFF